MTISDILDYLMGAGILGTLVCIGLVLPIWWERRNKK
jgi:hypothetical protein